MYGVRPAGDAPARLTASFPLLKVGELPQVMHRVQGAHLDEPRTHTLHDLAANLEAPTPVCLPLEQLTRVEFI